MPRLPTGRITFLFTDIEGSTRLLQHLGDGYRAVLEQHARLIRAAVASSGGVEVNAMGDGFFAAFGNAARAVEAAVAAQTALAAHAWPDGGWVRVRMGLHTGEAAIGEDGYVGLDVHRAARICAAGHGGQILVSAAVAEALGPAGAAGIALRDLRRHRLKDLVEPEHLFQVVIPHLLAEFPPPRSLDARPHNLPSETTDLVGRDAELREARRLLAASRMLTLCGPGGTGKTRLALRLATEVLVEFEDGVFFVPLAAVRDPKVVPAAIAEGLGIRETDGRPFRDVLVDHLRPRQLLLVLDNLEQVVEAAPMVGALLAAAPGLKVLATSRARLRVGGEQVFEVPPLAVPGEDVADDPDALAGIEAVRLFVQRVTASDPGFALTHENAAAVARVVRRLEGLPLAIELAAARSRLFPPQALSEQLEHRLAVLRGGARDLPARHRALRDTVAWSYELLEPGERTLFRRLGTFVGGFTLDAAEQVAAGEPVDDVVEAMTSLLDKSLLRSHALHGEARLSMLETIRELAVEAAAAAGETHRLAARHARHYLDLVEEAEPHLTGRGQVATLQRLAADQGNLRAALGFCLDGGEPGLGLRLASALWRFWQATGQLHEGREWLDAFLARPGVADDIRAKGLTGLASLAYWQGDYKLALAGYREALELYRGLGDELGEADTLFSISTTSTWLGDAEAGARHAERALAMFERLGARGKVGMVLMAQGFALLIQGDPEGARPLWEQSRRIAREVGDDVEAVVKTLAIASIDFRLGRPAEALASALAALEELVAIENVTYTIMALDWVAALAAEADPEGAVRLAGAAAALRARLGGGMRPEASGLKSAHAVAARRIDAATLDRLWEEGRKLGLAQAVDHARRVGGAVQGSAGRESTVGR